MMEENYKDIQEYLPKSLSLELCICTIQESFDQLTILKSIYKWPEVNIKNFTYKSLKERFENTVIQEKDFENIILKQCGFILSLFGCLLEEMKNDGTHIKFSNDVKVLVQTKVDEKNISDDTIQKERKVRELQSANNNEKENYVYQILNCMAEIGRIKNKIENFQIESEIKLNYLKSWQNSKLEMQNESFSKKIEEIANKIDATNSKTKTETLVHNNFDNSMTEFQQELEEQVEAWKTKYYETLEIMNKRIDTLQEKQNKQLEVISNLKTLYQQREQGIFDWNVYKIEQEKIRLEKEKRNKAATKIQAWWKGTMVRKGFGKFRKKKEKKSKKSSEKTPIKK